MRVIKNVTLKIKNYLQIMSSTNFLKFIAISLIAMTIIACNEGQNTAQNREKMVGEWESNSVLISIKSAHRTGGDSVVNIPDQAAWTKIMSLKPIHTLYRADHSYEATYRNLKDSIVALNLGIWRQPNDSTLQLIQQDPYPDTSIYSVRFLKDGAEFRRFQYDFDKDGSKDDEFFGIQRKIR